MLMRVLWIVPFTLIHRQKVELEIALTRHMSPAERHASLQEGKHSVRLSMLAL